MEEVRFARLNEEEIKRIQSLSGMVYGSSFIYYQDCVKKIIKKNIIVICLDSEIIGILHFGYYSQKILYKIHTLIVDKKFRGKGYGTKLFKFFIENALPRPIKVEILSTTQGENNGEAFWRKLRFRSMGEYQITKRGNYLLPMLWFNGN